MKISHKLLLSFLLVATLASLTTIYTLRSYKDINSTFAHLLEDPTKMIEALNGIKQAGLRIVSSTMEFSFVQSEAPVIGDADMAIEERELAEGGYNALESSLRSYEDLVQTVAADEAETLESLRVAGRNLVRTSRKIIELKKENISGPEVLKKKEEFEVEEVAFLSIVDEAMAKESNEQLTAEKNVHASIALATRQTLIITALTFVLAIFSGLYISFLISRRIRRLKEATQRVGRGELDGYIEIDSLDEVSDLSRAFNKMITDLRSSRSELAAAEGLTDKVLEAMVDFVVVTDLDLTITKVNKSTLKLNGYEEHELIGQSANILMADRPFSEKGIEVLRKNGFATNIDKINRNKDGSLTPISMSLSVFQDEAGNDLGIVCVGQDVSERRRSEAEREIISEVIQGITTTANLDELLHVIHRSISRLLYAENCFVALYDRAADLLSVPFFVDKFDVAASPSKLGTGLTAYVLRKGESMLMTSSVIDDLTEKGDVALIGTSPAVWLGVPLRTPTGIVGVLVVQHYDDENAYTKRDLEFLGTVGDQIAMAIERRRVEDALRISEAQHRLLFEANPQPAFVYDTETLGFLAVNDAAVRHYGYSREELLSSITAKDLRAEEDVDFIDQAARIRPGRDLILVPSRHRKNDGTVIDVEITSHVLTFAGRRAEIVLVSDVTERKRSENALRENEEKYRELFENANDVIYTLDLSGNFTSLNRTGETVTGYTRAEAVQMSLGDIIDPKDLPRVQARVAENIKGTHLPNFELEIMAKDERKVTMDISSRLIVQDGVAVGIQGIGRDITERLRAQVELERFNEKLQQSNRELQDFAYVASHDLQEPLRKVQAFSDRLKTKYSDKLEGEGLDYLERMRSAASRMQMLIQDLLTFSRVSTKAQPFVAVDLENIAKEVLSDLEVKIEETGAIVEVKDLPTVEADPMQMRQLLQNLIGNALKFQEKERPPHITIGGKHVAWNGNGIPAHFEISVSDNGIGFDEKYTDKIFAVFQRLHGRNEYEGSGVGLAICRKIVERHNGQITVRSEPGNGATFSFTLPLRQNKTEITQ